MTAPRKLTKSEAGQLGGLARARTTTPEQRQAWGRMGAEVRMEKYGTEGMVRMRHARWGRLTGTQKPRVTGANESSQEGN